MAIKLEDKPNVTAPSVDYSFGDIKDNPGDNSGTPVNRLVYADFHQFFAKMADEAGIVFNGLPDNDTNGYQYFLALQAVVNSSLLIKKKIVNIGDWNMDSTTEKIVTHSTDLSKIRGMEVFILNDDATGIYPLGAGVDATNTTPQGAIAVVGSASVILKRLTGGIFDSSSFNSTSYNRGYIIITYVD